MSKKVTGVSLALSLVSLITQNVLYPCLVGVRVLDSERAGAAGLLLAGAQVGLMSAARST